MGRLNGRPSAIVAGSERSELWPTRHTRIKLYRPIARSHLLANNAGPQQVAEAAFAEAKAHLIHTNDPTGGQDLLQIGEQQAQ